MKEFGNKVMDRIGKTFLVMLKPSFLSWVVGIILIGKEIIPCNSITEFGIFSACLIGSVAVLNRFKK